MPAREWNRIWLKVLRSTSIKDVRSESSWGWKVLKVPVLSRARASSCKQRAFWGFSPPISLIHLFHVGAWLLLRCSLSIHSSKTLASSVTPSFTPSFIYCLGDELRDRWQKPSTSRRWFWEDRHRDRHHYFVDDAASKIAIARIFGSGWEMTICTIFSWLQDRCLNVGIPRYGLGKNHWLPLATTIATTTTDSHHLRLWMTPCGYCRCRCYYRDPLFSSIRYSFGNLFSLFLPRSLFCWFTFLFCVWSMEKWKCFVKRQGKSGEETCGGGESSMVIRSSSLFCLVVFATT